MEASAIVGARADAGPVAKDAESGAPVGGAQHLVACSAEEQGGARIPDAPGARVVCWTAPRCMSTAFERIFVERGDTTIFHEPFGLPYHYGAQALCQRPEVRRRPQCSETFQGVAQEVFDDPAQQGHKHVFSKDMAYYLGHRHAGGGAERQEGGPFVHGSLLPLDGRVTHTFLIRHPAKACKSMHEICSGKLEDFTFYDHGEASFEPLHALWQQVRAAGVERPVVIDADDLLEDPAGVLRAYCEATGLLPFDESALSWTPGPVPIWDTWAGWHDDALQSNGIRKAERRKPPPDVSALPAEVQETISVSMPLYEEMYATRLLAAAS